MIRTVKRIEKFSRRRSRLRETTYEIRRKQTMAAQKEMIRIRLKAYDHQSSTRAQRRSWKPPSVPAPPFPAPFPCLPRKRSLPSCGPSTNTRDSREQFERRTHKRLIDVVKPSPKTVEALMSSGASLPAWRSRSSCKARKSRPAARALLSSDLKQPCEADRSPPHF